MYNTSAAGFYGCWQYVLLRVSGQVTRTSRRHTNCGLANMAKKRIAKVSQKIMLDIGCGGNKQRGFTGMDKRKLEGVDIVHDVEKIPYPLKANSCAVVTMSPSA